MCEVALHFHELTCWTGCASLGLKKGLNQATSPSTKEGAAGSNVRHDGRAQPFLTSGGEAVARVSKGLVL
jgi:hypothetical protein